MSLVLRTFTPTDEEAALRAWRDFQRKGSTFLTSYCEGQPWPQYLELLGDLRSDRNLTQGQVPAAVLAADVDGLLVGRVSVRFRLNDYLATYGGHIGFAVIEEHRRKGYATEMLYQAIRLANENGISPVLLTCDDDNIGSAAVIEHCGGILESTGPDEVGVIFRRYWV
ncbi:MAG: GNAT family N-acetyltransferase [Acidobacteria bacterium]|nr:GNAT family N-acetyltransferase [Acidobacteriota bacterium]